MRSALIANMLQKSQMPVVTASTCGEFIRNHSMAVLFFSEDPQRYPESNDVAMVLPEILKQFSGMAGALVDEGDEHRIQRQFDFTVWPALAFFKQGYYLGSITGIQNWEDYLYRIERLFSESTVAIPVINIEEFHCD